MIATMCMTYPHPRERFSRRSIQPETPSSARLRTSSTDNGSNAKRRLSLVPRNRRRGSENGVLSHCDSSLSSSHTTYTKKEPQLENQEFLPGWLAHTFTTLPRNHPLRVVLPSQDESRSSDTLVPSDPAATENTICSPESPYFAFVVPEQVEVAHKSSPRTLLSSHSISHRNRDLTQTAETSEYLKEVFLSYEAAPFSTPGPASKITHRLTHPMMMYGLLSPTRLVDRLEDTGLDLDSGSFDRHAFQAEDEVTNLSATTKTSLPRARMGDPETHESVWMEPEEISHLFDSPGPCYYDRHAAHYYESPTEDCIEERYLPQALTVDVNELDFRWNSFKPGQSKGTNLGVEDSQDLTSKLVDTSHEIQVQNHIEIAEGSIDWTPSPPQDDRFRFRFQATLGNPCGQVSEPIVDTRKAFAPAPGIYLSPLGSVGKSSAADEKFSRQSNISNDFGIDY